MGRYVEHRLPPGPGCAVEAVWGYELTPADAGGPPSGVRVLPDGHTDLIVRFEAGPRGARPAAVVVCGPTDRVKLRPYPTSAPLVGARLRPGWAGSILGVAPADLFGVECDARACGPRPARLLDRLRGCATVRECLAALADGVSAVAADRRPGRGEDRGRAAAELVGVQDGDRSVFRLARQLGVSERTLHRDVVAATGLSPRTLEQFQVACSV